MNEEYFLQAVQLVYGSAATSSPLDQSQFQAAEKFLVSLRYSDDGIPLALHLLKQPSLSQWGGVFWALGTIEEHYLDYFLTSTDSSVTINLYNVLLQWIFYFSQVHGNTNQWKISLLKKHSHVFVLGGCLFFPHLWASFIDDLILLFEKACELSSESHEMLLYYSLIVWKDLSEYLTGEHLSGAEVNREKYSVSPSSPSSMRTIDITCLKRATVIKDVIREQSIWRLTQIWMHLIKKISWEDKRYGKKDNYLHMLCVELIPRYVEWIPIETITTSEWIHVFHSFLSQNLWLTSSTGMIQILIAILRKKQLPEIKWKTMTQLGFLPLLPAMVDSWLVRVNNSTNMPLLNNEESSRLVFHEFLATISVQFLTLDDFTISSHANSPMVTSSISWGNNENFYADSNGQESIYDSSYDGTLSEVSALAYWIMHIWPQVSQLIVMDGDFLVGDIWSPCFSLLTPSTEITEDMWEMVCFRLIPQLITLPMNILQEELTREMVEMVGEIRDTYFGMIRTNYYDTAALLNPKTSWDDLAKKRAIIFSRLRRVLAMFTVTDLPPLPSPFGFYSHTTSLYDELKGENEENLLGRMTLLGHMEVLLRLSTEVLPTAVISVCRSPSQDDYDTPVDSESLWCVELLLFPSVMPLWSQISSDWILLAFAEFLDRSLQSVNMKSLAGWYRIWMILVGSSYRIFHTNFFLREKFCAMVLRIARGMRQLAASRKASQLLSSTLVEDFYRSLFDALSRGDAFCIAAHVNKSENDQFSEMRKDGSISIEGSIKGKRDMPTNRDILTKGWEVRERKDLYEALGLLLSVDGSMVHLQHGFTIGKIIADQIQSRAGWDTTEIQNFSSSSSNLCLWVSPCMTAFMSWLKGFREHSSFRKKDPTVDSECLELFIYIIQSLEPLLKYSPVRRGICEITQQMLLAVSGSSFLPIFESLLSHLLVHIESVEEFHFLQRLLHQSTQRYKSEAFPMLVHLLPLFHTHLSNVCYDMFSESIPKNRLLSEYQLEQHEALRHHLLTLHSMACATENDGIQPQNMNSLISSINEIWSVILPFLMKMLQCFEDMEVIKITLQILTALVSRWAEKQESSLRIFFLQEAIPKVLQCVTNSSMNFQDAKILVIIHEVAQFLKITQQQFGEEHYAMFRNALKMVLTDVYADQLHLMLLNTPHINAACKLWMRQTFELVRNHVKVS